MSDLIIEIEEMYVAGKSISDIATKLNVSESLVKGVVQAINYDDF